MMQPTTPRGSKAFNWRTCSMVVTPPEAITNEMHKARHIPNRLIRETGEDAQLPPFYDFQALFFWRHLY